MIPLPAHPTPGVGPPASTQMTPQAPFTAISSSVKLFPFSRIRSSTVFILLSPETPPRRARVESALGSQPICITVYPSFARATATFDTVVDLPMPPFPYIAIFFILVFPLYHFLPICNREPSPVTLTEPSPLSFFPRHIQRDYVLYGLAVYLHLVYDSSDAEYFFYIFLVDYRPGLAKHRHLTAQYQ